MSEVSEVADRRSVLVATGLAAVGSVSLRDDASGLHEACMAALTATVRAYETSDLITTTSALVSLERTTQTVPREHRLRGRPSLEWMRLHAAVTTVAAATAYDRGKHSDAAVRADRAAALARAAGDGPLAARALALRARVVRPHSPAVSLQIAGAAARIAGHSSTRALIAGKVVTSACAATGDRAGVRDAVARAWQTMERLDDTAHGSPGFSLDTYSPADLALACAEALTTVGAADEAMPHLERAATLITGSGQTGMVVSVRMAQARAALAREIPDRDEAAQHAAQAVALSAGRPAEWVARLVRDVSDLAERRTGHGLDDLLDATSTWLHQGSEESQQVARTQPARFGVPAPAGVMVQRAGGPPTVPALRHVP
ncbi:hypothetical protein [Frankia sp. CcWB3]